MSTRRVPVFTEVADCRDCYRCIRVCPVKSIAVRDRAASVVSSECVACGQCVTECPQGRQRIRSDVDRVQALLQGNARVVVSLSSAWASEFMGTPYGAFVQALRALGFDEISELGLGAEAMARECAQYVAMQDSGIWIVPVCPAVTQSIQRDWSHWTPRIIPVLSPLLSHASLLKAELGPEVKVVGIGPCVSQKLEADEHPELVEAVITFGELHSWMLDRGIHPKHFDGSAAVEHVPRAACGGHRHTIARGALREIRQYLPDADSIDWINYSGFPRVREALMGLESWSGGGRLVIELLACGGGCVHGPGASRLHSLTQRQLSVYKAYPACSPSSALQSGSNVSLAVEYKALGADSCMVFSARMLAEQLAKVGRLSAQDEINCGSCGYETCQRFAVAMCQQRAEPEMCVPYQRRVAEEKFNVLLNHMPSGVVVVDANLRIVEANWNLAQMLGPDVELVYDRNPGLTGLEAELYIPFHRFLSAVLRSGEQLVSRDERVGNRLLLVSVFTVQAHQLVCAIVRNMYSSEVRGDEIVHRSNALIVRNLETVQKIAYLLGENAAHTESELNGIVQSFMGEGQHEG